PADASLPEAKPMFLRLDPSQLRLRVAHVECLVQEDLREDRSSVGIACQHFLVDDKPARGRLLREVEESEQRIVARFLHRPVVQAALAWGEPVRLETLASGG